MSPANSDNLGEQLSAYLDGELADEERGRVERLVQSDPTVRSELDRMRQLVATVGELPKRSAPADLAGNVMASLEREHLLVSAHPSDRRRGLGRWRSALPAAAMIVITVGLGVWALLESGSLSRSRDGRFADANRRGPSPIKIERLDEAKPALRTRDISPTAAVPQPQVSSKSSSGGTDSGETAEPAKPIVGESLALGGRRETAAKSRDLQDEKADRFATVQSDQEIESSQIVGGSGIAGLESAGRAQAAPPPKAPASGLVADAVTPRAPGNAAATSEELPVAGVTREYEFRNAAAPTAGPLELEINCNEPQDMNRCVDELDTFLARQETENARRVDRPQKDAYLYANNRRGLQTVSNQLIEQVVQIPQSQLGELVSNFDGANRFKRSVSLSMGSMVQARGWSQTEQLVNMVPGNAVAIADGRPQSNVDAKREGVFRQIVQDLLKQAGARVSGNAADEVTAETRAKESTARRLAAGDEPSSAADADESLERSNAPSARGGGATPGIPEATPLDDKNGETTSTGADSANGDVWIDVLVRIIGPLPPEGPPGQLAPK